MGLPNVREPHVKHIRGPLWEMRLKGKAGIARALYVTAPGQRVVVLRVFVKKTEKTPPREIEQALEREGAGVMAKVKELHRRWSKDPEYKAAYDALEGEFQLADALIEARTRAGSSSVPRTLSAVGSDAERCSRRPQGNVAASPNN